MTDKKKKTAKPVGLTTSKVRRCENCMAKAKANKADSKTCPCGGSGNINLGLI